ncbi:phosphoribosylanthranilate isomerase [Nitrolancea hollandica]|uniref:N-(5'-phosphoribosyl)anthranilate isomerase n=1 Tax=Nitrolancea hollandica Lb TaxID=1129897 RepID=I4EH69_9BACT|nr:phosphoribosylanthranilate isomerase [Nitrolancea hollandica]CCF84031.1 N-(5'-phosphoribosyl)anthranilate isomerase [Nitrolancea hollandica Lb]
MNHVLVKVCGVRTPEDARVAADVGADLIGLVFAPSSRRVTIETAVSIADRVRSHRAQAPALVGVFVNEPVDRIVEICDRLDLAAVQCHGDEPPEVIAAIGRPVVKALRLGSTANLYDARRAAERYLDSAVPAIALLIDSHVPGHYGGTGTRGNWEITARLAEEYPVILAGGLCPETVRAAIETVLPLGVDVSSGVETGGIKDHDKIRSFVGAARRADAPALAGRHEARRSMFSPRSPVRRGYPDSGMSRVSQRNEEQS